MRGSTLAALIAAVLFASDSVMAARDTSNWGLALLLNEGTPRFSDAINTFDGSSNFCSTRRVTGLPDGFKYLNETHFYQPDFVGRTDQCYRTKFLDACTTREGLESCNTFDHRCVKVSSKVQWNNPFFHPEYVNRVLAKPSVCISRGAYMSPDAAVLAIAQVMFSWILLTTGTAWAVLNAGKDRGSLFMRVVLGLMYIPLVMMFFSYYYLNAILGFAVMFASFQLFSVKNGASAAYALGMLFLCFFWASFENGLGDMQHHSRFVSPNLGTANTYEKYCDRYYHGFFAFPEELRGDFENPQVVTKQFCDRQWLAAGLFWMINLELMILLAALAGLLHTVYTAEAKKEKVDPDAPYPEAPSQNA